MPNICDTFARNFVPKSFQKSPNLDTLLPLSKDISEHKMEESHFGGMNGRERERSCYAHPEQRWAQFNKILLKFVPHRTTS